MTNEELKSVIQCIHKIWYQTDPCWTESPQVALKLHRHMGFLFNFAEIESSLMENNPGEVTPEQFESTFCQDRQVGSE